MKLDYPFIQLPLKFDAKRLLDEVNAMDESAWQPHPQGYAGNDAMTLITPHGINNNDEMSGPMQPTDYLKACPYVMQVLRCIGGVWGRTRLMRLSGQAEVTPHIAPIITGVNACVCMCQLSPSQACVFIAQTKTSTCKPVNAGFLIRGACITSSMMRAKRGFIWWQIRWVASSFGRGLVMASQQAR